jgi:DNA-binding response OmpR family regulator
MSPSLRPKVIPLAEVPRKHPILSPEETRPVILIVDDERVIADTLAIILSRNGFATFTAYDGESALELAGVVPPELLISDVMMPGMTGVELAIALGTLVPDCKVLLFSGQAATADLLSEAHKLGHDFTTLTKPVHPTDMLMRISECLKTPDSRSLASEHTQLIPANA